MVTSTITNTEHKISATSKHSPDFSGTPWPTIRKVLEPLGWMTVILLMALGLAAVIMRAIFLANSFANPEMEMTTFDIRYYTHYLASIAHLIPAVFIAVLGPLQFVRPLRRKFLNVHRWSGRVFVLSGVIGALTGFFIGAFYPFAGVDGPGLNESMSLVFWSPMILFCLYMAIDRIKKKMHGPHREWMIRGFSLMVAIATERVILGIMVLVTGLDMEILFGITIWMAIAVNMIVAECWIILTRTPGNGARHWKDVDASAAAR